MLDRNALKKHLPGVVAAAVLVLALLETAQALVSPFRAPSDDDWQRAAAAVRGGFKTGDLIVAAPDWADPVMRRHLGSLVTVAMAARLDDAAYGRVWELTQKGAGTQTRGQETFRERFGNLTLRRIERTPVEIKFDFVQLWQQARVMRDSAAGIVPCALTADRFSCPDSAEHFVKPALLEFDFGMRMALFAPPVSGAAVVMQYDDVPLGRTLTVGAGLHHVWLRKAGQGEVTIEVFVAGQSVGRLTVDNRSAWQPKHFDTGAFAGQRQIVRFVITSPDPSSRHFGFAAEARQ